MSAAFAGLSRLSRQLGAKRLGALILVLAGLLVGGFYLGWHSGAAGRQLPEGVVEIPRAQLSALRESLDIALGELQMLRTGHAVDSQALVLLRSEITIQKQRVAELEEGLSFYRSMLVSDDAAPGLHIQKPELVLDKDTRELSYRIFVRQKNREHLMVEGVLSVEIFGEREQEAVNYALADLSADFHADTAKLRFRYFQLVAGRLTLPAGFIPRGIMLSARTNAPSTTEVVQEYPWELQERFIHVGP